MPSVCSVSLCGNGTDPGKQAEYDYPPFASWGFPPPLAVEQERRAAGDAGGAGEDVAGVRLRGQVGGREVLPGGGDVQGAQVRAAERGRADLADRQLHDGVEAAVRGVAAQLATAPDSEPEAALHVQGQAVRHAADDLGEAPLAGQRAGVRVGVER